MRIAIVGGGATGALASLHLARALGERVTAIMVVEPAAEIGRGLAYATDDPRHLLNVRVANMSAYADEPDHFLHWLKRADAGNGISSPTPFCFIPRGVYGAYLSDLVGAHIDSGQISHVRDRCIDLVESSDAVELTLESGNSIVADTVVLATGNGTKHTLRGVPTLEPWTDTTLSKIGPDGRLLIIGTGLTMADQVLSLDRQGHRGKITALSHHGLLPTGHRPVTSCTLPAEGIPFGAELSEITAWLRRFSRSLTGEEGDWRSTIDAIRPHTQRLWRSMSPAQKRRFLRHARAYWDVLRHRMAPEVEAQITAFRRSGRLDIVAAKIVNAEPHKDAFVVELRRRGRREIETYKFAAIINCTGFADDPLRSTNPLVRALLARGAVRPDPLGIGLDVSPDYALLDSSSRSSQRLRAVGPLARAAFWECIAIPDIRLQCQRLAESIAIDSSLRRSSHSAAKIHGQTAARHRSEFHQLRQSSSVVSLGGNHASANRWI